PKSPTPVWQRERILRDGGIPAKYEPTSSTLDLPLECHDNQAPAEGTSPLVSTSAKKGGFMTEPGRTPWIRTLRSRLTAVLVVGALGAVVAAGALAQSGKSSLIGKLEGPEVVTDPAKFPRSLKEAPQLAALVKAGKLPPVAERVGQDPLVIQPLHENGKQGVIEKVDTHTVRFKFPEPYFMLPDVLAGSTDLGGQWSAYRGMGGFAPAHYLKQFHPKYVGEAELDRKVKEAKFDSWVRMFLAKNDWALNPDLLVLSPWKTATAINTATWTLERNPYSVFVDTEGNQLPYIDRVVLTLAENLEVVNLRAIAGEYDFQQRHIDLGKLPVFI